MKRILLVFIVLPLILSAQPDEYKSRGIKSYLVNYGAMQGNPFLARFAARRFVLLDESSPQDISLVHKVNPTMPILVYRDVVALHSSFEEFNQVNLDEMAFMHSGEPSCLNYSFDIKNNTGKIYWLQDRRDIKFIGYMLYTSSDSTGSFIPIDNKIYSSSQVNFNLADKSWLKVKTVLPDSSEINYGFPVQVSNTSKDVNAVLYDAAVIRDKDTIAIYIKSDITTKDNNPPDSVVISIDENRDNRFGANESYRMKISGNLYAVSRIILKTGNNPSFGGYEFVINVYRGGIKYIFPETGMWNTNINNRLMNDYYGFYIMNVGTPTWRKAYIGQVLKSFSNYGYTGLFEDDTWIEYSAWAGDAYPAFGYTNEGWKQDLFAFLDSIKAAIAPKPAYFNGLYVDRADSLLLHTDGGMTEGFGSTHWSDYVFLPYWRELCNVGLKCQNRFDKTWLCLGGIHDSDPEMRMYDVASYLLCQGEKSIFANANSYQEFAHYPEFDIPSGEPQQSANLDINDLLFNFSKDTVPYYMRWFENCIVIVNPNHNKPVVIPGLKGRKYLAVDNLLTIDGGRLYCLTTNTDTIYPKHGRIFINSQPSHNYLVSPYIDSVSFKTELKKDGQTELSVSVWANDSSSANLMSDYTKPLFVVAETGNLGGPKELELFNDDSPAGPESKEYKNSVVLPAGISGGTVEIPVSVYSTTGLVTVLRKKITMPGPDSTNLLTNFSFEFDNNEDMNPDNWTPYYKAFDYDTTGLNAKTGNRSVHLKNDSLTEFRGIYQRIIINQSLPEDLVVGGWSKSINVSGIKDNGYAIYVDLRYQDDTPLYGQTAQFSTGTHDWEYSERIIKPQKPVREAYLYCLFRAHTGEAWFDQIKFGKYIPVNSVNENEKCGIYLVNPNPANDFIEVNIDKFRKETGDLIQIYSHLGHQVISTEVQSLQPQRIDISYLPAGVYFIRFGKWRNAFLKN